MRNLGTMIRGVLAVGACLAITTSAAEAQQFTQAVNVFLPHVSSNATLSTQGIRVIGVGKLNLKKGRAQVKASGVVQNPFFARVRFRSVPGGTFGLLPSFVCTYNVKVRGAAVLKAVGFGVGGFTPPDDGDGDGTPDLVDTVDDAVDADLADDADSDGLDLIDAVDDVVDLDLGDDGGDKDGGLDLIDAIDDVVDLDLGDDADMADDGGLDLIDAVDDVVDLDLGDDAGDMDDGGLDLLDAVDDLLDADLVDDTDGSDGVLDVLDL